MIRRQPLPSILAAFLALLAVSDITSAQELYRNQMAGGGGWTVRTTSGTSINVSYEYSADDIPEAPNSRVGDVATTGFKLEANISAGASSFMTLSPAGQNFTGNYQLRFDAWMNYDADQRINRGSYGTTKFIGGGVGYDGVTTDVASGAQVVATGDGGSISDWRAFKSPPQFFVPADNMSAGDRNGANSYYSDFLPGVVPPAGQAQIDFPPGTAGSPGFQWITFEFTAINNVVHVSIERPDGERLKIVDIDCNDTSDMSSGCSTDGNVSLFYADFFAYVSPRPDLTFGLIDNVEVSEVAIELPGDYNENDIVDTADFVLWRKNPDAFGGDPGGYVTWRANFGHTAAAGSAIADRLSQSVPEPAAAALAALALLPLLLRPGRLLVDCRC